MGTWDIHIRGTGCHNNCRAGIDADLATADFVKKLKAMGATVTEASFTNIGQSFDMADPDAYVKAYGPGSAYDPATKAASPAESPPAPEAPPSSEPSAP